MMSSTNINFGLATFIKNKKVSTFWTIHKGEVLVSCEFGGWKYKSEPFKLNNIYDDDDKTIEEWINMSKKEVITFDYTIKIILDFYPCGKNIIMMHRDKPKIFKPINDATCRVHFVGNDMPYFTDFNLKKAFEEEWNNTMQNYDPYSILGLNYQSYIEMSDGSGCYPARRNLTYDFDQKFEEDNNYEDPTREFKKILSTYFRIYVRESKGFMEEETKKIYNADVRFHPFTLYAQMLSGYNEIIIDKQNGIGYVLEKNNSEWPRFF